MEISEKPQAERPRVMYSPHRLHVSGVAAGPPAPVDMVMPEVIAGDSEIANRVVRIEVEVIPLDEPK